MSDRGPRGRHLEGDPVAPSRSAVGRDGRGGGHGRLRLVGAGGRAARTRSADAGATSRSGRDGVLGQPIRDAGDPRWVLAVKTGASLQGAVLTPDRRERLIKTGRALGLSPFDANLVIAIVQDQARRGTLASYCPAASAERLAMVPPARKPSQKDPSADPTARSRWWRVAAIAGTVATLLAFEWMLIIRLI